MTGPHEIVTHRHYRFAIGICLVFVMTRSFYPDFFDNEWIYSLNPIKILRPDFLENDFYLDQIYPFFLFFDALTSPLYYFMGYLNAVLLMRIAIWSFQLWALARLARTMGITWWGYIFLVVIWLNVEQTLAAGAWIILSANSKPVAYGFMFLAIDSLLNNRLKSAGVYAGLSASMHVVVGFWLCAALTLTLVVTRFNRQNIKGIVWFCLLAVLLALPGILPPFYGEFKNLLNPSHALTAGEVAKINVLFANPFHMDPGYFMTYLEPHKIAFFFVASIGMMLGLLPRGHGRQLACFIGFICLFFISGIVARSLEWYAYLKYFPFRLADAFVPLAFWMGFVIALQKVVSQQRERKVVVAVILIMAVPLSIGLANYVLDRFEPPESQRYDLSLSSFALALSRTEPRMSAYHLRERVKEWKVFLESKDRNDLEAMERWIRENTPNGSIFIRPPWESSFSIKAQRADVVSIKPHPGPKVIEYVERLKLLNRGEFQSVGHPVWFELMRNYPHLSATEITDIAYRYSTDYFLTYSDAQDSFSFEIVHQNDTYTLYSVNDIHCEDRPAKGDTNG